MSVESPAPLRDDHGAHKVAALLIAMGKPTADRLLKHFSQSEIKSVATSAATLGTVPRDRLEDFVSEIASAVDRGADVRAGADDVEKLLAGIVQPDQLAEIVSEIRGELKPSIWTRLNEIPESAFVQFSLKEHPQVVAYVLSKVPSRMSASIVMRFPPALRSEVVRRILAMGPISERATGILEKVLKEELFDGGAKGGRQTQYSYVADIINNMERPQSEEILSDLDQHRPKDAKRVKGLLFSFDDVARLSASDRVKLFDVAPVDRVIGALRDTSAELRELVLSSISARSRRMIEQELSSTTSIQPREVAKAKRAITALALELAQQGAISIGQESQESEE
ncbi:MAG: flagellar motor switch protein FliG [Proteobacteria bacterium]|nr:flagellar motor switch protein FliG [Pseudomonadota bacterium]